VEAIVEVVEVAQQQSGSTGADLIHDIRQTRSPLVLLPLTVFQVELSSDQPLHAPVRRNLGTIVDALDAHEILPAGVAVAH